ncbi:winged helix-turn-helix domain-containing protein [Bacteroides fragilis]
MELETIGENAGKVWRTLNEMRGEISIQELSRKINLSAEDVALAVGWLAREIIFYSETQLPVIRQS